MDKFKVKAINTPDEIFVDAKDIDIILHDDCLLYEFDGYYKTGTEQEYFLISKCSSKTAISMIRLIWNEINQQYQITLFITGASDDSDIVLLFNDFDEAHLIHKKIIKWRFGI